jgi:hypothetical protein
MTPRIAAALALVLALQITAAAWWLPQKWQACQKLYDNHPAQVFCLLSSN